MGHRGWATSEYKDAQSALDYAVRSDGYGEQTGKFAYRWARCVLTDDLDTGPGAWHPACTAIASPAPIQVLATVTTLPGVNGGGAFGPATTTEVTVGATWLAPAPTAPTPTTVPEELGEVISFPGPEIVGEDAAPIDALPAQPRMGWDSIPWSFLEAIQEHHARGIRGPGRILPWHVLVYAELIDQSGEGKDGGKATRKPKQIAVAVGHDEQRIRKLLTPYGPLPPWVTSKTRKHKVAAVGCKFAKLAHWWLDDLAGSPCEPIVGAVRPNDSAREIMSGRALGEAAIIAALTLQRIGSRDHEGTWHSQKSTSQLAEMAGLSTRGFGYGLAEAERRGWVTSSDVNGERPSGGWSVKARRRVHTTPFGTLP